MTGSEEKQWQYLTTRLLTKMVRIKGTIEAPNRDGAEKKLKADGYAIMSLTEQNSPFSGGLIKKKVKSKDLAVFCKQFSAVIRAGVTIISALN